MVEGDLPIGRVITLTSGDARAEITTVGAHLRRFQVGVTDLILTFGDELPWGAHGAVLAPWPNRIRDGRYSWHGRTYELPVTEPERNTAIHGLVMTTPWEAAVEGSTAMLTTDLAATPGYPFPLRLEIQYHLSPAAVDVTFRATNTGSDLAPFGVGFHPWLDAGPGGLEGAVLQFDADGWYETDAVLIPTSLKPLPPAFDFTSARQVGDTGVDDAFTAPQATAAGHRWVHLDRADGVRISVWMSGPLDVWQLCSHPGPAPRPGLAVEPMSCPADAFNSGIGVDALEPGAVFSASWGITYTKP